MFRAPVCVLVCFHLSPSALPSDEHSFQEVRPLRCALSSSSDAGRDGEAQEYLVGGAAGLTQSPHTVPPSNKMYQP